MEIKKLPNVEPIRHFIVAVKGGLRYCNQVGRFEILINPDVAERPAKCIIYLFQSVLKNAQNNHCIILKYTRPLKGRRFIFTVDKDWPIVFTPLLSIDE